MKLPPQHQQALDKFVATQKKNPRIIGIVLTGSFVHSIPDKNSDLDVCIILDNKSKYRERGNLWINGVEVEYFMNPIRKIRKYFKEEQKAGAGQSTAHMLSHGRILFKRGTSVDMLVKEAKRVLNSPIKGLSRMELEMERYGIDDLWKDYDDVYTKKDAMGCALLTSEVLRSCLELFFVVNKIRREKSKRLYSYLSQLDPTFARLYKDALLSEGSEQYQKLSKLVAYTEKQLGGKRPHTWKLRSKA